MAKNRNQEFAQKSLDDLRHQVESMHPDDCCEKGLMVESNGSERMLCVESCQWSKLSRMVALVMVDVEVALGSASP